MKYTTIVKPGRSEEKIITTGDHEITVYLRAKPPDGEANDALIRILSEHFNVPKTAIRIIRGHKSRNKVIEL